MKQVLAILIIVCTTNLWSQVEQRFDSILSQWKDTSKPGVAAGAIHNGKIIYLKGFGASDIEAQKKITPQTKFQVDDLAKQFTVLAVLLLEQQGKISFNDNIRKYLPDLPEYEHPIKIKHLLNHTSGLNNLDPVKELLGIRPNDLFTKEDVLKIIGSQEQLNFIPGSNFSYHRSDTEIILLSEIVAKATNQSFTEYTSEHIFKPLKMKNTTFNNTRNILQNTAKSYQVQEEINYNPINDLTLGATNLYTTVEDLAKWYLTYTNPTSQLGKLIKKLDEYVTTDSGKNFTSSWGTMTYGRYFDHLERGLESIWQFGLMGGYGSNVFRFHTKNFTSFVLGNNNRYNGMPAMSMAYDLLKDDFPRPQSVTFSKNDIKKLSSNQLKKYEGFYWKNESGLARKIYIKNDTLRYKRLESGRETAMVPLSKNKFQFAVDSDDIIVVTFSDDQYSIIVGGSEPDVYKQYKPSKPTIATLKDYEGIYYNKELDVSYTLVLNKENLEAKNLRTGTTQLYSVFNNVFRSNTYMLSGLEFTKNEQNEVTGFSITTDGLYNLKFKKI